MGKAAGNRHQAIEDTGSGWTQISMFVDIEKERKQAALDFACRVIRELYFDYVQDRSEALREGEHVGGLITMEEFAAEKMKSYFSLSGLDGPYCAISFYHSSCHVREHGVVHPYEFSKFQILREI